MSKQLQLVQSSKLVVAGLSFPELGTAQPQLVITSSGASKVSKLVQFSYDKVRQNHNSTKIDILISQGIQMFANIL